MRRSLEKWVRTSLRRIRRVLVFVGPAAVAVLAVAIVLGVDAALVGTTTDVLLRVLPGIALAALLVALRRRAVRNRAKLLAEPLRTVHMAAVAGRFYEIGVEQEAIEALEATGQTGLHAAYLPRDVDAELRERIEAAMRERRPSLIAVSGPPRSGKSRTLAEAAAAHPGRAWLIVPRDAAAVAKLAEGRPPVPLISWRRPCVIWLDDLERYVRSREPGLNEEVLAAFSGWRRPVLLLATAGGKGVRLTRGESQQHAIEQGRLLGKHPPLFIETALTEAETSALAASSDYGEKVAEGLGGLGIAEFMVAATRKRLLLDVPSERPVLGIEPVARALRDIVVQSEPRFAIGIFGGWGSGKTTLMRAIEIGLRDRDVVCVPFVAWRYEKEEHLIVPLLDAIREALVKWADEHDQDQAARQTAATVGRVVRSILAGVSLQAGLPGAMKASFDANRALQEYGLILGEERNRRVPRSFYHASFVALKEAFAGFVGAGSDPRRVVVFVDDLDRCLPENALQILESMKLFFDLDGFVFIVGLDQDVIEYAVEKRYGSETEGNGARRISGEEYIKKIFQLPYPLAPVATTMLADFVRAASDEAQLADEQKLELRTVVEPHLRFLAREGAINPREVKRYINLYTLRSQVDEDVEPNVVLALQTLEFRQDWRNTIRLELFERRQQFLDVVRSGLALAEGAPVTPELTELSDEFLAYVADQAPGHALLETTELDRHLSLVQPAPALLDALGLTGQVRRLLRGAAAGNLTAGLAGELATLLSQVEARVTKTAGTSPQGQATMTELRALQREVADVVGPLVPGDLPEPDELARRIAPLSGRATSLSRLLRQLYRAGEGADVTETDDVAPPHVEEPPPPGPVAELSARRLHELTPEELGVHPSRMTPAPYVPRDVDFRLGKAIESAVGSGRPVMTILIGPPKAGKTRTLYEALIAQTGLEEAVVVTPADAADVAATLDPEAIERLPPGPVVLWFDGLERFVGDGREGLRPAAVTAFAKLPRRVVAVGTGGPRFMRGIDAFQRHPQVAILQLEARLRAGELERFRTQYPSEDAETVERHGLGPWFVDAQRFVERLATATLDEGIAVVRAAVDWARAGMARPIPDDTLRGLWPHYLAAGEPTDERFDAGVAWAVEPVVGSMTLVERLPEGFVAADALVADAARGQLVLEAGVWEVILGQATPEDALALGIHAVERGDVDHAAEAFAAAARSSLPEVAGAALLETGRQLARAGDDKGAEAAYRRAEAQGNLDAHDELGVLYEQRGDIAAAEEAYHAADDRGHAGAATHLGRLLHSQRDLEGAVAAFRRADERGDLPGTLGLAEVLSETGDPREAQAAYERADERGSADGALNVALQAQRAGEVDRALAALRRADERGSAEGASNLASMLVDTGDHEAAEAAYRRAIERGFPRAGLDLGDMLQQRGDREGARAAYEVALGADSATARLARDRIAARDAPR